MDRGGARGHRAAPTHAYGGARGPAYSIVASSEMLRSSASRASPLTIDCHDSSCPFRFPFSTTFTPSGEMVTV
jgi:hypothetical protein